MRCLARPYFYFLLVLSACAGRSEEVPGKFSFDSVRALAAARAQRAYLPPVELDSFWRELSPADAQRITFRAHQGRWERNQLGYHLAMRHPQANAPQFIRLAEIRDGAASPWPWDVEDFDYGQLVIPAGTPPPASAAGVQVMMPLNEAEHNECMAEFAGHTLLRMRAPGLEFGTSTAALALNPGGENEEVPAFTELWFERPTKGKPLHVYGLLDSPSVAGAYHFRLEAGSPTTLEVQAELHFRAAVAQVCLAPLSSLCWFTELTTPKPADYHPEVHSADGLLVQLTASEAIWRPLDSSAVTRRSLLQTDQLLGFGLIQRDREFASYQDLEGKYQLRPSVYVRPVGKWPAGSVQLIEHPASDEATDNVQAAWVLASTPHAGQSLSYGYIVHWTANIGAPGLSKVLSSRQSQHFPPAAEHRPNVATFVIDFAQSASLEIDQTEVLAALSVSAGGTLLDKQTVPNPTTGGWRVTFHLEIAADASKLDLECRLLSAGRPISERWNYQWIK